MERSQLASHRAGATTPTQLVSQDLPVYSRLIHAHDLDRLRLGVGDGMKALFGVCMGMPVSLSFKN